MFYFLNKIKKKLINYIMSYNLSSLSKSYELKKAQKQLMLAIKPDHKKILDRCK